MKIRILDMLCMPARAYDNDAGLDLKARKGAFFFPFQRKCIKTGVCISVPQGYCGDVRPRSNYSLRGIDVKLGTIDADYIGEISVVLKNSGFLPKRISKYERIAQFVVVKILEQREAELEVTYELPETPRGTNGFGSTGV